MTISERLKHQENIGDLYQKIGLVKKATMGNAKERATDTLLQLAIVVNDFDARLKALEDKRL